MITSETAGTGVLVAGTGVAVGGMGVLVGGLGVGAALLWNLQWLFYLALGIGFVEILESSALIAVWRRGGRITHRTSA